jgi:hypothetical protein
MRSRPPQAGVLIAAAAILLLPACRESSYAQVACEGNSRQNILHLVAQAVPSATLIPCFRRLTPGWSYGGSEIRSGFVHYRLDSDRVGVDAVDVTMAEACTVVGDIPLPSEDDDASLRLYEEPTARHPGVTVRHYWFPGGCVTVRFSFTREAAPVTWAEAADLLGFSSRSAHVKDVREETGLSLCGAGAPPCPG